LAFSIWRKNSGKILRAISRSFCAVLPFPLARPTSTHSLRSNPPRMRTTAVALCVLLGVAAASAQATVLTTATFDAEVVSGGKNAIVKFYAPWCVC
jgi:hypothetical protein